MKIQTKYGIALKLLRLKYNLLLKNGESALTLSKIKESAKN